MRRRHAGLLVLIVSIFALTIHPAFARDLRFGFTPVLGQSEMQAEFEPFTAYLSDAIGEKVVLYIAKDYGDLRTQMEAGAVDIGSFSPFAYVDAAKGGKIRIIAQSIIDGSATYRGIVVCPITSLAACPVVKSPAAAAAAERRNIEMHFMRRMDGSLTLRSVTIDYSRRGRRCFHFRR